MAKKSANLYIWVALIAVLIVGIGYVKVIGPSQQNYDDFAKCLSASGAKFYGAYWCPHCETQKKSFGKSQRYVPYVECAVRGSDELAPICQSEGIERFPTWKFSNGEVVTGAQSFERIAELSGCEL